MLTDEELTRLQMDKAMVTSPDVFRLLDRDWDILPGVFPPDKFASTSFFAGVLEFPAGGSFLEIGSGAGVVAVTAALAGTKRVVATDINPAAVDNTCLNARRHGVQEVVESRRADLFDGLQPEQFDMIFWNSNFIAVPEDYVYRSDYEKAFFDPGYRHHKRFLNDAPMRLRDGGCILLGFSSLGNTAWLNQALDARHLSAEPVCAFSSAEEKAVTYQLLNIVSN